MKKFLIGLAVAVAVVGGAFAFLADRGAKITATPPGERIQAACERQYGADERAVTQCRFELGVRYLDGIEREKMDQARRSAGL